VPCNCLPDMPSGYLSETPPIHVVMKCQI
jgi:hypothetical protein